MWVSIALRHVVNCYAPFTFTFMWPVNNCNTRAENKFTMIHSILCVQFTCLTVLFNRSSLVFLLVLDPLLHTPCISSPSYHHLFAARAHTNAACSIVYVYMMSYNIVCLVSARCCPFPQNEIQPLITMHGMSKGTLYLYILDKQLLVAQCWG